MEKLGHLMLPAGMKKGTIISKKSLTCNYHMTLDGMPGHFPLRNEDFCSHKNLYMKVDSIFMSNRQKLESSRCSSTRERLHHGMSLQWRTTEQGRGWTELYSPRLWTVGFHLHNILEKTKPQKWRPEECLPWAQERWEWEERG